MGPKTIRPSGTRHPHPHDAVRRGAFDALSKERDLPQAARLSPEIVLRSVVFPAPLAPMSATTSPSSTDSDTSSALP